jgi:outer membrane protein insertion porin family/translocation and assembly module TamA
VPRAAVLLALVPLVLGVRGARAVQLDALDLTQDWQLRALDFAGTKAVKPRQLRRAIVTKTRPFFAVWRDWPPFDPVAFRTDLERIRRFYEARGYYHVRVAHDVELPRKGRVVRAVVYVEEGPPVRVGRLEVVFGGAKLRPRVERRLLARLPLRPGDVFDEEKYDATRLYLRGAYREHGYARVEVRKRADVDLKRDVASVDYEVDSGPSSVFGETRIETPPGFDARIVRRELAYEPGDKFRQSLVDETRANLTGLNLFRAVNLDEEPGKDQRVDYRIRVDEAPPREVRLGIGYDTEEQVRGLASWRHYNFLGGARQLGFSARASLIERALQADFLQPHFPGESNRTRLLFQQAQEEEDAFTLDRTRFSPRLEWQATRTVTGFAAQRVEYDSLSSVNLSIRRQLPGIAPPNTVLAGLAAGADWNATDDLVDPTRGWLASGTVEPVTGDVSFVRMVAEGRFYQPLVGQLRGAARLRLGVADPIAGTPEIPLYERFYAGGINSVRGYGRWRIGPFVGDEPVGGRTLVETSVELRHPITDTIGAAVFLDGGRVSLDSYDFPVTRLRYGTGFGVRYKSPVGPLRVDIGFPIQEPRLDRSQARALPDPITGLTPITSKPVDGDQRWQIHVSLGAAF